MVFTGKGAPEKDGRDSGMQGVGFFMGKNGGSKRCFVFLLLFTGIVFAAGHTGGQTVHALEKSSGFSDFEWEDEFDEFDEFDRNGEDVFDPLARYNRAMTTFNDRFYFWVLKPTASGYAKVTPKPVRRSVNRFFRNLGYPARAVNNLLQLKGEATVRETVRFLVNSTVGIAGLFDPAGSWMGIEAHDEDFGQTLGNYGMGSGFHIVLPLLGPSNLRDSAGLLVDGFMNPVYYFEGVYVAAGAKAVDDFNHASLRLGEYERMTEEAIDLYIFLRNAYEQNRESKIEE